MAPKIKDRSGQRIGFLTILSFSKRFKNQTYFWCKCDCGTKKEIRIDTLDRGTVSCSCYHRKKNKGNRYGEKHGMAYSRIYDIWHGMKQRCMNPRASYFHIYGGRGITICERWMIFENFYSDMGDPPKGMSLDRINNNGNYEPSNCRWATPLQQSANSRNSILVSFNEKTKTIRQWAKTLNIPRSTLYYRIKMNWPIEKAFNFIRS